MEQHNVKVFSLRSTAHIVKALLRIDALISGHFGHELIAITREALERFTKHRGSGVSLSRFKKADSVVVRVMHEPRELLLPKSGLYLAGVAAGAESEACNLHA